MTHAAALEPFAGTANDRLKGHFPDYFAGAVVLAAAFHFVVLAYWPDMAIADLSISNAAMEQIEIPPRIEIPPPPEPLQRPAVPLLSSNLELDTDITIPSTILRDNPIGVAPLPSTGRIDVSKEPSWTPHEVRPELRNREEYARSLTRRYPVNLRNAGLGGTVLLWVFIDDAGRVQQTRVVQSTGYAALDTVAQEVMREVARFTPALNRDRSVAVWIQLPVTFEAR